MDIELRRTYRSNRIIPSDTNPLFGEPIDGPLGYGWMTPFFVKIADGDTFIDADGRYFRFKKDSAGNFITDYESGLTLKKTSTGYELKKLDSVTRTFDSSGKLLSKSDNYGNTWTMSYDLTGKLTGVIDPANRTVLKFTYDGSGHITKAEDHAGRAVHYGYDGFGNLVSYTDAASNLHTYTYNSYHGLTGKTNPVGETVTVEYQHPDKGIVNKIIDPVGTALRAQGQSTTGHEQIYLYDFNNKTFYITDWNGNQRKKTVNDKGQPTSDEEVVSGKTVKKVEYLSNRVVKTTDEAGNVTTEQKDEWGNVTSRTDGEGNEWKYTYATGNRLTSITHPDGRIDKYEYDTKGNLKKQTLAFGLAEEQVTDYAYNAYGKLESRSIGGAVTSYAYNEAGLPTAIAHPIVQNITRLEYDQYGNLTASVDPSGNRSEFIYDVLGNLIETKDPLGNRTIQTYNAAGRLVKVKDALLRETTYETNFKGRITAVIAPAPLNYRKEYEYDGNGNLKKITEGSAITTFTYDSSNRLTSITDGEGNITTYEYSTASSGCTSCGGGNSSTPAKVTDPFSNQTQYSFDANGRVKTINDPLGNLTSLAYDSGGRVSSRTDANGNITKYEYDSLGRLKKQINVDAINKEILFSYDYRGNLASLTDPNGHTTTFEYDLADRKTRETNPLTQSTEYAYYPNNLLNTVKDANGQIATYNYDDAGRLTNITYADLKQDNFTYDAVGNLLTYANESVSGSITYDALNRKLSETVNFGAFSKTYSYTYDDRGNKATYTSPEGVVYSYSYRLNNQPAGIAFNGNTITFEYLKNRHIKTILPNGITTDYQYNANSWLTYITTKQGTTTLSDYNYGFDNIGNITSKNTEHGNYNYSYDTTYQLTDAVSPAVSEGFTYDNSGNRLTDSTTSTSLTFGTTEYYYNSRNRLERVTLPDGRIATYTYDPFGRRIKKDVAGQVTYFAYSDEGLIGEYDQNGNLTKAYGWAPNSTWGTNPVFMVEGANYYFYHNDHLGTPQKLTDINGNTVWSASYTSFGNAQVQVATVTNNLRFPGQYLDEETGHHYNWNRYYDPNTGRYTQEDPIGFVANDQNLYRYSFNNTENLSDPSGLLIIKIGGKRYEYNPNDHHGTNPPEVHLHDRDARTKIGVESGNVYDSKGKKVVGSLDKKVLERLREVLRKAGYLGLALTAIEVSLEVNEAIASEDIDALTALEDLLDLLKNIPEDRRQRMMDEIIKNNPDKFHKICE